MATWSSQTRTGIARCGRELPLELGRNTEPALNEVVKLLQANASWAMVVAGHTDNVGVQAANLTLSRDRAQSVIAWLSAHGVAGARLVPAGFGDSRPIAENQDDAGRQKNRRVDLVKLY